MTLSRSRWLLVPPQLCTVVIVCTAAPYDIVFSRPPAQARTLQFLAVRSGHGSMELLCHRLCRHASSFGDVFVVGVSSALVSRDCLDWPTCSPMTKAGSLYFRVWHPCWHPCCLEGWPHGIGNSKPPSRISQRRMLEDGYRGLR